MARITRNVPVQVQKAAASAWRKWSQKMASLPPAHPETEDLHLGARHTDPNAGKSPHQLMIEKIKLRMKEYPEWYETDQEKVTASVCAQLERIGDILGKELPETNEAVDVWDIPLSVFNWLIETDEGESFHHGALSAWSRALSFNAANGRHLDSRERQKLRQPFLDIAPPMLQAVLEQLLKDDLWVSFAEKFVGPELKYLTMRVQRPVEPNGDSHGNGRGASH